MRTALLALIGLTLALSFARPANCQVRPKIPEPQIERKTTVDDKGFQQWAKYDVTCPQCRGAKTTECERCKEAEIENCAACKGKKKTKCRICAGEGKLFDPLKLMVCPYCDGLTWYSCGLCGGKGSFPVKGSGDREIKCGGCKKVGAFKCTACRGKHLIPCLEIGRTPVHEASVKELDEAKEQLQETLALLEKVKITSNESDIRKELTKAVRRSTKLLPALKNMQKLMTTSLKALRKGAQYTAYNEWLLVQGARFQDRSIYLLRHQILLIDICRKRAKHNEDLQAKLDEKKD